MGNKVCEELGHDWDTYTVPVGLGYYSYDVEQAGYCKRCGYDTHGQYHAGNQTVDKKS